MFARRISIGNPAVILTLIGIAALLPSFLFGPGATHSYQYNIIWTGHFGQQFAAGHVYDRWLPASFEGLGSPTFYFYPPFAYWVSGAFDALGLPVAQAINLSGLILLIASGLTMYAWLARRSARPLLGAALYMIAPYHLYDFYVRGALAEYAAFIWLPLIALAIDGLPHRKNLALLALTYAALILSHLPLAMLTGIFFIAPVALRKAWQERAAIFPGTMAGIIALGLPAFYLLPALTLQDHVSTVLLWTGYFRASNWSIWTVDFEIFPCLALALVLLAWPSRSFWTAMTVFCALAALNLIPFIWDIPPLYKAQFPWRLMGIVEFCAITALMSGPPHRLTLWGGGLLLIFPYLFGGCLTQSNMRTPVDYRMIERVAPDAPEYLPRGFDLSLVRHEDRTADLRKFSALQRGGEIKVDKAQHITLGRAAFPIWRVTRDGMPVESRGPLINFDARPGTYRIERITIWQEKLGIAISLAAALLLLLTQWPLAGIRRAISHLSKFPPYSPLSAKA